MYITDAETIRRRLSNPTTEIDEKVKYNMDNGFLISEAYLIDALLQNWNSHKVNILVGFPRNIEQLNALKFHLNNLNDKIEKIINYTITDFDEIYNIAQTNYGKVYDSYSKDRTIESMRQQMEKADQMIERLEEVPKVELNFLDEDISCLEN